MTASFPLGRVAGIEIRAHWSWLLIVTLLLWSLTDGVFPATNPGLSDATYLAMALAATLLFFLSLTLHELGHAIQARREGMAINGITLWVFGGVAQMRSSFPSAMAELRVAVAGPAVSLALGLVFLAAALLLPLPDAVDGVSFWVGQINLSLLLFNLLPALPLDGGRVLRALLWRRRGDFTSATRTAGSLGRVFGQLMVVGGLALALLAGDLSGLWLVFLGWFLLGAAEAEVQGASARDALAGLHVADLMVPDPVVVAPSLNVQDFIDGVFLPTRHTAYPVVDATGRPLGLVGFRSALDVPREQWSTTSVRAVMVPAAEACVDPETPLADVMPRLAEEGLRRLLVCRDGRLVGLLSFTDVSRALEARARAGARMPRAPTADGLRPGMRPAGAGLSR
jgi:Zn-dependent protease/CBS domain-containing protein